MNKIPLYHVDAFTQHAFGGNPAAVIPLSEWPEDVLLQQISAENNLSETAFFVAEGEGYRIRWFTPLREVDLCGHATLATAFVITRYLDTDADVLRFSSASGELTVRVQGEKLELDFPARPVVETLPVITGEVGAALGIQPLWCGTTRNPDADSDKVLAVYDDAAQITGLRPDMAKLKRLPGQGLIASAPGDDCDFVSRYFVPKVGIEEDPVTGSAHCSLVPYWADKLDKTDFFARQVSARGGELWCALHGDRVRIAGHAVLYLQGTIVY